MTVFSKIIQNSSEEQYRIMELDENFLVMLSLNPVTKGHALVIPVAEVDNLADFALQSPLFETSIKWADKITKKLDASAYTLKIHNKLYTLESKGHVNHLHLHIIPRYSKEDKVDEFPERETKENLESVKNLILS